MKTARRDQRIYRVTLTGSVVNIVLLVAKFVAGILGHSAAMVADAVHSLTDFVTDIIVLVFVKISNKPADENHHYGHGKFETLASAIIGMALLGVAILLAWNGLTKIWGAFHGQTLVMPGKIALVAALLSIVLKEWVFRITKKMAREVESPALEANAWHHRSDALSSIGTALGIGGAILLGNRWVLLDPLAAIVVSIMIFVAAYRLLRQAFGELMEESLPRETVEEIKSIIYQDKAISDIHQLRTRRIGSNIAMEMHLRLPGNITLEEAHQHASNIEEALRHQYGANTHINIHIEPAK